MGDGDLIQQFFDDAGVAELKGVPELKKKVDQLGEGEDQSTDLSVVNFNTITHNRLLIPEGAETISFDLGVITYST